MQVQMLWNQAHAPLLVKRFPKTPRTQSITSCSMDLITTKQNKTNYFPSYVDVFHGYDLKCHYFKNVLTILPLLC